MLSLTYTCVLAKYIVAMSCSASAWITILDLLISDSLVANSADSDFYFAVAAYLTSLNVQCW